MSRFTRFFKRKKKDPKFTDISVVDDEYFGFYDDEGHEKSNPIFAPEEGPEEGRVPEVKKSKTALNNPEDFGVFYYKQEEFGFEELGVQKPSSTDFEWEDEPLLLTNVRARNFEKWQDDVGLKFLSAQDLVQKIIIPQLIQLANNISGQDLFIESAKNNLGKIAKTQNGIRFCEELPRTLYNLTFDESGVRRSSKDLLTAYQEVEKTFRSIKRKSDAKLSLIDGLDFLSYDLDQDKQEFYGFDDSSQGVDYEKLRLSDFNKATLDFVSEGKSFPNFEDEAFVKKYLQKNPDDAIGLLRSFFKIQDFESCFESLFSYDRVFEIIKNLKSEKEIDEAKGLIDSLQTKSSAYEKPFLSKAYLELAFCYDKFFNNTKAFESFDNSLKIDKKNSESCYQLAFCYHHGIGVKKDFDKAANYYKKLFKIEKEEEILSGQEKGSAVAEFNKNLQKLCVDFKGKDGVFNFKQRRIGKNISDYARKKDYKYEKIISPAKDPRYSLYQSLAGEKYQETAI